MLTVLAACRSSSPPREQTPHPDEVAVVAHDAAIDAAIAADAPMIRDASIDAPRAASTPSPPTFIFLILAVEPAGPGARLKIGAGSKQGISKDWEAFIIGDDDRRVENGELVIEHVHGNLTVASSRLYPDMISGKYRRVRIRPR